LKTGRYEWLVRERKAWLGKRGDEGEERSMVMSNGVGERF
jgi:hypothetical protein